LGNAHTNTIENFWSLLKGGISGVYHAVSGKGIFEALGGSGLAYNPACPSLRDRECLAGTYHRLASLGRA